MLRGWHTAGYPHGFGAVCWVLCAGCWHTVLLATGAPAGRQQTRRCLPAAAGASVPCGWPATTAAAAGRPRTTSPRCSADDTGRKQLNWAPPLQDLYMYQLPSDTGRIINVNVSVHVNGSVNVSARLVTTRTLKVPNMARRGTPYASDCRCTLTRPCQS